MKTPIAPDTVAAPFGVWTPAIMCDAGRLLFISGMTARDENGDVVGEGDYLTQTRQVCRNLQKAVEQAGGTLEDIMQVAVYAVDVEQFANIHKARKEYFPNIPPASAMVEVSRLIDKRCLIEISAIAVL